MKTGTKLSLVLALATSGAVMAGCGIKSKSVTPPQASPSALDTLQNRQPLAQKLFAKEGFNITSLRTTSPDYYLWSSNGEGDNLTLVVSGYQDCYNVQKAEDDGHLYEKCTDTSLGDQTVTVKPATDLGIRVSTLQPNPAP